MEMYILANLRTRCCPFWSIRSSASKRHFDRIELAVLTPQELQYSHSDPAANILLPCPCQLHTDSSLHSVHCSSAIGRNTSDFLKSANGLYGKPHRYPLRLELLLAVLKCF